MSSSVTQHDYLLAGQHSAKNISHSKKVFQARAVALEAGRLEIEMLVAALRAARGFEAASSSLFEKRLLVPAICDFGGSGLYVPDDCTPAAVDILRNDIEEPVRFPLFLNEGYYFSEVVAANFPESGQYRCWVDDSLAIIYDALDASGVLPFSEIDRVGRELQQRDTAFARLKIDEDLDAVHAGVGVDAKQSLRMLTLCRTSVLVAVGSEIVPFFYEKYLYVYSLNGEGEVRLSTHNPVVSGSRCYRVAYFAQSGSESGVIEQHYELCDESGRSALELDGSFNPELLGVDGFIEPGKLRAEYRGEQAYQLCDRPIVHEPLEPEDMLCSADHIYCSDGLFCPRRVLVHNGECGELHTRYNTIENCWGPKGCKWLFDPLTGKLRSSAEIGPHSL